MRIHRCRAILALFLALLLLPQTLQSQTVPAAAPGRCYAMLVIGTPGAPLYARHYLDWATRFEAHLKQAAGPQLGQIILLSSQADIPNRSGEARLASVKEALARLASKIAPQDQFVLFLLGHGGPSGSLALDGPDLPPEVVAEALGRIKARRQVILQFSGYSGAAAPVLAGPGRIIITSSAALQPSDSDFPEFLLLALEGKPINSTTRPSAEANIARLSLLGAFNIASHEYAQWITRQRQTESGWVVEGRKSRTLFERLYGGEDVPAGRKPSPSAPEAGEDLLLPLVPSADGAFWGSRRLVTEQPMIEDTGSGEGLSPLGGDGYKPIQGDKPAAVGDLARKTVLGVPDMLVP